MSHTGHPSSDADLTRSPAQRLWNPLREEWMLLQAARHPPAPPPPEPLPPGPVRRVLRAALPGRVRGVLRRAIRLARHGLEITVLAARRARATLRRLAAAAAKLPARLRPSRSLAGPAADRRRRLRLARFLAEPSARLAFPACPDPVVSILVLNYNRADQLFECLESIRTHTNDVPYELIVADNASTDRAPELLRRLDNARVLAFRENLGFVRGNNAAAAHARGRYLLLLNNDTIVTPGWLSRLVQTMETWPRCGAVGPQFLCADGRLQEAGTMCWANGSVNQYGIYGDAHAPEYQHVREVDYCSGACLLVRTDLFRRLGGFDERFAPCYYEDTDLCFGVRSLGYSVVYQPAAVIYHHGPTEASVARTIEMCEANRGKFADKWRAALATHPRGEMPGDLIGSRDRRPGPRVLVIDPAASESVDELSANGAVVTCIPVGRSVPAADVFRLRQLGVEVIPGGRKALDDVCRTRFGCYEAVLVGIFAGAEAVAALARRSFPATPVYREFSALAAARRTVGDAIRRKAG
jgi:GT2 family glycosyltransferase